MQIGMIGLGRMGGHMARWLMEHTFAERVLSTMLLEFGGHVERPSGD